MNKATVIFNEASISCDLFVRNWNLHVMESDKLFYHDIYKRLSQTGISFNYSLIFPTSSLSRMFFDLNIIPSLTFSN